jgi:hypothetical protein
MAGTSLAKRSRIPRTGSIVTMALPKAPQARVSFPVPAPSSTVVVPGPIRRARTRVRMPRGGYSGRPLSYRSARELNPERQDES